MNAVLADVDDVRLAVRTERLAERLGWQVRLTVDERGSAMGRAGLAEAWLTPVQARELAARLADAAGEAERARLKDMS